MRSSTGFSEGEAMLREMKYGALSGKTRAMYGKLLRSNDYLELIQKKSVGEVVSYLKNNTHYKLILTDIDENNVHRDHLENVLKHDLITDYAKLLRFTNGKIKNFIDLLYAKIEIESLKLIFRVFEAGHVDHVKLEDSLLFLAKYGKLNIPKLALSRNLEEFLLGLGGTEYYDVIRPFTSESNETRLFNIEMALDLYYLTNIRNCYANLLDSKDCGIIKELVGFESDIFNIFWIYRSKSFYNMESEVIKSYTLPPVYKLKKETLSALIHAREFESYVDIIRGTPYWFLFEGHNQLFFEHNYAEFIYKINKIRFRRQPFSIACVISYLRLKEFELSNIISITEGIRYRLPEENIRKFIVGIDI